MHLYFMRHGHTNYNERGLCNDEPNDDVHLSEKGIRQAKEAAQKLSHIVFDRIIVSELPRTRQTAEIIRPESRQAIETSTLINDIRSGFNNLPVADYFAATGDDRLRMRINNGESVLDYKKRVAEFINWLEKQDNNSILVVCHEETMRIIYAYYHRLNDQQMLELHFSNCQWFDVELQPAT